MYEIVENRGVKIIFKVRFSIRLNAVELIETKHLNFKFNELKHLV